MDRRDNLALAAASTAVAAFERGRPAAQMVNTALPIHHIAGTAARLAAQAAAMHVIVAPCPVAACQGLVAASCAAAQARIPRRIFCAAEGVRRGIRHPCNDLPRLHPTRRRLLMHVYNRHLLLRLLHVNRLRDGQRDGYRAHLHNRWGCSRPVRSRLYSLTDGASYRPCHRQSRPTNGFPDLHRPLLVLSQRHGGHHGNGGGCGGGGSTCKRKRRAVIPDRSNRSMGSSVDSVDLTRHRLIRSFDSHVTVKIPRDLMNPELNPELCTTVIC